MELPVEDNSNGPESEEFTAGVRLVALNLPEDEGDGFGFRLTRTMWDPYPWVREVVPNSRADIAGLRAGDCLLQTDGRDLLGLPVGQVATLIRGDGAGRGVTLLVWNCGVDPKDDPELLWSCGGGSRGEKSRRALAGVIKALSCCVCAATATRALSCARSHLYCEGCWMRLERCALCRETLPAKDSPYSRNLVAEQVFEAIATEYEIKDTIRKPIETASVTSSPVRSPCVSPLVTRKGQYQISMMSRNKKNGLISEKRRQSNYASDPNIHRISNNPETYRQVSPTGSLSSSIYVPGNTGGDEEKSGKCNCHNQNNSVQNLPEIKIEDTSSCEQTNANQSCCCKNQRIQHKLVTRLRQACSMADLNRTAQSCSCGVYSSMNNIVERCAKNTHSSSLDSLQNNGASICENQPMFVFTAPPIYVMACDHEK